MKAICNGELIAESEHTVVVEGNHYFPQDSIRREFLTSSDQETVCPWKGTASYYDVTVNGEQNEGAAWYYATPKAAAEQIRGHVAFWRGVEVVE